MIQRAKWIKNVVYGGVTATLMQVVTNKQMLLYEKQAKMHKNFNVT